MLTEFGEKLDKFCPLAEYPRPQLVRSSYLNLNGEWECEFSRSAEIPAKFGTKILVPFFARNAIVRRRQGACSQ